MSIVALNHLILVQDLVLMLSALKLQLHLSLGPRCHFSLSLPILLRSELLQLALVKDIVERLGLHLLKLLTATILAI